MKELQKKELKAIKGGFSIWGFLAGLAASIFGVGVIEGYARPHKFS